MEDVYSLADGVLRDILEEMFPKRIPRARFLRIVNRLLPKKDDVRESD